MRGFRGTIFKSVEEHNSTITNNLLALPRGSNLVIAGDLFWKFSSKQVEEFFTKFKKAGISIYIVFGNHDKMSWFKYSIIRSQGYAKPISVDGQSIFVSHYNQSVWNKSHYDAWLLFGHTHHGDSTWERAKTLNPNDTYFTGKKLNINIELHDFKPWSFEEVKAYMDTRPHNWDFITQKQKDNENENSK
jgi:calcineurin-like phosphoesterase family protein